MALDTVSDVPERVGAPPRSRLRRDLTTVPNLLSLGRIFLVLAGAVLYIYGFRGLGLVLGVVAGLTDLFDGIAARKLDQVTELGAILDRFSDLVFEGTGFVVIVFYHLMSSAFCIAYLLREFVVLSARLYVAQQGGDVPTSTLGKRKTNFLAGALLALFLSHSELIPIGEVNDLLFKLGYAGIVAGLVFSYLSGAQYLRTFASVYTASRADR